MNACVLASGSTGNSTYVESDGAAVLVDCGLTVPELQRRLHAVGRDLSRLAAIFITHDHGDHVGSSVALARRLSVPLYATAGTISVLRRVPEGLARVVTPGTPVEIEGLSVRPFSTPHDGIEPVAYRVTATRTGRSLGIATDLGYVSRNVVDELQGVHLLVVEHNHDERSLIQGPYPAMLKRRILGPHGHLSNEQGAALAAHVRHEGLRRIVLAHLSETNNTPDLARAAFERGNIDAHAGLALDVAEPRRPSPMYEV